MTLKISWSQMRNHEECRQKSYLLRSGKKPKLTNIRSYFHGMVVDRAMRDWLANPLHTAGEMIDKVTVLITEMEQEAKDTGDGIVRWKNARDRADLAVFCVELVRRLEPILRELVLPWRYAPATRFSTPVRVPNLTGELEEILLIGETDLIVWHDDGLQIWDLKGTADDQYWRKTLGQLYFYDLAMLALHGTRATKVGLIQPMCKNPVLEFIPDDEDRTSMYARVVRMAQDIWAEERSCKEDVAGCSRCDVRHACPRFQVAADDDAWSLPAALRTAAEETA